MNEGLQGLLEEVMFVHKSAKLKPEAKKKYLEELKKQTPQINVLNPVISNKRIELVSQLAKKDIGYLNIIDTGLARIFVDIFFEDSNLDLELYNKCMGIVIKTGNFLNREFINEKEKLLAVSFLAKAMLSTMIKVGGLNCKISNNVEITDRDYNKVAETTIFHSYSNEAIVKSMVDFSDQTILRAVDLLDVSLSWMIIDELTAYESLKRDSLFLDYDLLKSSAEYGKLISKAVKSYGAENALESTTSVMILLKIVIVNKLGTCSKKMFYSNVKDINTHKDYN